MEERPRRRVLEPRCADKWGLTRPRLTQTCASLAVPSNDIVKQKGVVTQLEDFRDGRLNAH